MIYFDNAATTRYKPDEVYDAFNYYIREIGTSPGRGSYSAAIQASRMLYNARKTVVHYFGACDPSNVAFTKNSTEAINLLFQGYLRCGDHVLITPFEHNAVLRPLHAMKEEGIIDYTVIDEQDINNLDKCLNKYLRPNTKLFATTLASNLTGQIVFNDRIAQKAQECGLLVFLDSSQGAGKYRINMEKDHVDVLAFTGHKDLMALPGVGGLVSVKKLHLKPLIQGGTGIHGESYSNPEAYPDAYEAGTLNMPAIWSLKVAMEYVDAHFDEIQSKEKFLMNHLIMQMKQVKNVILYNIDCARVATLCFNIKGMASSDVVRYLDKNAICVRGGIHCAILAHEALGTVETGAVRVSINYHNTVDEIDEFIGVLRGMS